MHVVWGIKLCCVDPPSCVCCSFVITLQCPCFPLLAIKSGFSDLLFDAVVFFPFLFRKCAPQRPQPRARLGIFVHILGMREVLAYMTPLYAPCANAYGPRTGIFPILSNESGRGDVRAK